MENFEIENLIEKLLNFSKEIKCPKCGGSGRKKDDNREGYVPNGRYAQHTCTYCCGIGIVKAKLSLDWLSERNRIGG